jgi:hypothetical protein
MRPIVRKIAVIHLRIITSISEHVVLGVPIAPIGWDDDCRRRRGKTVGDHLIGVMAPDLSTRTVGRQDHISRDVDVSAGCPSCGAGGARRIVELHHVQRLGFIDPRSYAEIRDGNRSRPPVVNLDAKILVLVVLGVALDQQVEHRVGDPRLGSAKGPRRESGSRRSHRRCGGGVIDGSG